MSNDLMVPENNDNTLALFQQEAEQQIQLAQENASEGYSSAYIRGQEITSTNPDRKKMGLGVGSLEIRFNREDIVYPRTLAVLPIDVIGTRGGFDKSNPTPRKWLVPYDNKELIDKYGFTWCQTADGIAPDAASYNPAVEPIHGRTLVHPDANGQQSVVVRAGYNTDKTREIEMHVDITDETKCVSCVFARSWWSADSDKGDPAALQACCAPNPAAVFYVLGADSGFGKFGKERRMLAQCQMYGQATRVMFGAGQDSADTKLQRELGITQPMDSVINTKRTVDGGFPPNAVVVTGPQGQKAIFYFPYLLGTVVKKAAKGGVMKFPFLFNPADEVREYLRTATSPMEERFDTAVKNAAAAYMAKIVSAFDATKEREDIEQLLKETTIMSFDPAAMELYAEYRTVKDEYHREVDGEKQGRKKLTTPFLPTRTEEIGEEVSSTPAVNPTPRTQTPEQAARQTVQDMNALNALSAFEDTNFAFGEEEETEEEVVDGEFKENNPFSNMGW